MSDVPTDPTELGRYVAGRPWADQLYALLHQLHKHTDILYVGGGLQLLPGWVVEGALLALAEELAGGPVDVTHYPDVNPSDAFWQASTAIHPSAWGHRGQETDGPFAPTRAVALVRLCDALAEGGGA